MTNALIETLNSLTRPELDAQLERCCASRRWIAQTGARRPYRDEPHLLRVAQNVWWSLDEADWREAFAGHPRIGDAASLKAKYANTEKWAHAEQSGVQRANAVTIQRLSETNRAYEEKFGYIFIVCATGKSADEMLAILERRLESSLPEELRVAAGEQWKITELRLKKLVL